MSTIDNLTAARTAVGNAPFHLRAAWVNTYGLRDILADREKSLTAAFVAHPAPNPLDLTNTSHHSFLTARHATADFIALRVSLDLLEASADFIEADQIVSPLVANVRELEAQLQAETSAASKLEHDRNEAIAAAKAEALADVESRFALPEPEAAPEPEKPFRGRVKMATA